MKPTRTRTAAIAAGAVMALGTATPTFADSPAAPAGITSEVVGETEGIVSDVADDRFPDETPTKEHKPRKKPRCSLADHVLGLPKDILGGRSRC